MADGKEGKEDADGHSRAAHPDDTRVLAMLRESIVAGFSCVDLQGRFLRVNSGLCRMLGYTEQELLTMTFADVTHPDDHGIGVQIMQRTANGEYHRDTIEKRYLRRDGEIIWVLVSPALVRDSEGQPAWFATVTVDITASKRAELALQRSEERYRTYVDAAPDAVFVVSADGRYVDVNAAACRVTGFSRDELLSMALTDVAAFENPEAVKERLRILASTGHLRRQVDLRRKDGSRVPMALDAVKLSDGRMMAFCKDITDRIRAEEERRKVDEQLQQTQRLESLGLLAGGIAHDFNNLLVGVLGNAELLLAASAPSSPDHSQLQNIASAATRAGELCQQMLAFAGQTSVEKTTVDLSRAVREMLELLGSAVANRASVTYDLAADLPPIRADHAQIRQVIMNLITNAAESNADAVVHIEVATGSIHLDRMEKAPADLADELPAGRYLFLRVKDDGQGMDAETARQMFDPFFTTKARGRGLGLSALTGIVRAHGGAVQVDTEPGRGTTVQVLLPEHAVPAHPTDAGTTETEGRAGVEVSAWSPSGTILVVDDEPLLLSTLTSILETLGFEVLTAANGAQALTRAEPLAGQLRCVLLDYSMPDMTGNQVLAKLRAIDPEVPVLVMSGYGDEGIESAFAGLSVRGFVQKPFRMAELSDKIRRAIDD